MVNVRKEELFEVARASLKRNKADIIVANDLSDITQDQHIAYLVDEKTRRKLRLNLRLLEPYLKGYAMTKRIILLFQDQYLPIKQLI